MYEEYEGIGVNRNYILTNISYNDLEKIFV
jgi:hypothetical protein